MKSTPQPKSPPFKQICRLSELPPGSGKSFRVGKNMVAVFNLDGEIFALDDVCPHASGPLGDGPVTGGTVRCPWHGWEFDIKKACSSVNPMLRLVRYETKIKNGLIFVSKTPLVQ